MNKLVWIYNPFLYFAPSYLLVIHTEDSVLSDDNWAPFKGLNKGLKKKKKSRGFFFFFEISLQIWLIWFDDLIAVDLQGEAFLYRGDADSFAMYHIYSYIS